MGATLWHHEVPWYPDPAAALRVFQADYFTGRYNFEERLEHETAALREVLEAERECVDPHDLVAAYAEHLAQVEQASAAPLPAEPMAQIAMLRRVIAGLTPDGFGNVLDVTGVSDTGDVHVTRRLEASDVAALVGHARPTLGQVKQSVRRIAATLGRSSSVCFEIFSEAGDACSWFFVGYTHD